MSKKRLVLQCEICANNNYKINSHNLLKTLRIKKFCSDCRLRTLHVEIK